MKRMWWGPVALVVGCLAGCTRHEVEVKPIKVEPIHITVDINIRLQRELENLFAFEDEDGGAAEGRSKDKPEE